ncbi:metal-binding protein [Synechococcales cyanobacterium C]|uniref:Metal-binding protein n=1 Tax=Petrachloros mirabilis ULC683 TaxID=2781853 RepID=A0A8K1ZW80_9CYAN|nr:metal-binding protein [Petrachloros mirabilis]NCJ05216.1 metal-binding protein [Petrachloros mirabilis ULC683]
MPAGHIHDRITLGSLPIVGGASLALTQSASQTLGLCTAFLFSGLMFGPDLDIYSRQFCRWGPARVMWIPYQRLLKHRSWCSHGPFVGTALRLLYVLSWLALGGGLVWMVLDALGSAWSWQQLGAIAHTSWQHYRPEYLAVLIGLELGAMSHSGSDWIGSTLKRRRRSRSKLHSLRHRPAKSRRSP